MDYALEKVDIKIRTDPAQYENKSKIGIKKDGFKTGLGTLSD